MAFDATQKATVCEALEIDSELFNSHLTSYASYISAEAQARVETLLERYEIALLKYVDVDPMEKNFGARIRSEKEKADIQNKIASALLLNRASWYSSNSYEVVLERG